MSDIATSSADEGGTAGTSEGPRRRTRQPSRSRTQPEGQIVIQDDPISSSEAEDDPPC